jgi:lipopolysaccharide biosynthesis glycosyltransferase
MTAHIAFCIDNSFAPHLGVLLQSIAMTSPQQNIKFHVLSNDLSLDSSEKLKKTTLDTNAHIIFHQIDDVQISKLSISSEFSERLSQVTYFRLLLPSVLADTADKILFLDADMLVLDSLEPLFSVDLRGAAVAVVEDFMNHGTKHCWDLGLQGAVYFNAGMLLIDIKRWRELNISEQCFALLEEGHDWPFNDQDVLNIVLEKQCLFLEPKWNWQLNVKRLATVTPTIIHYNGAEKPWHHSSILPYTARYLSMKSRSSFANYPLEYGLDSHDEQLLSSLINTNHCRIVIYGAGMKGRRLAAYIFDNLTDIHIECMVDQCPPVSWYKGIRVIDTIENHSNLPVLIASKAYAQEIIESLEKQGITNIIACCGDKL